MKKKYLKKKLRGRDVLFTEKEWSTYCAYENAQDGITTKIEELCDEYEAEDARVRAELAAREKLHNRKIDRYQNEYDRVYELQCRLEGRAFTRTARLKRGD